MAKNNLSSGWTVILNVRQHFGAERAQLVADEFASCRVYIPAIGTPRHEVLAQRFGRDVAEFLADHYGHIEIDFPSQNALAQNRRQAALREDVENSNLTTAEIAVKHGVSRRWVAILRRPKLVPEGNGRTQIGATSRALAPPEGQGQISTCDRSTDLHSPQQKAPQ